MSDLPLAESETEGTDAPAAKLSAVHERAMDRAESLTFQQEIRAQSLEARRFVTVSGAQWEGAWGDQFDNAPRPEVDKITKSLEKIETDFRENRLTVDFVPACDAADDETANTLDGMHRADSYHFKAQQARDNAFQEAIRGGFGAYRLTTDYADPSDPEADDLRVNPGMTIVDADQSVYFDPASKLYDKSDAGWAFIVTADPKAAAERRWGAENVAPTPLETFKYAWDWYTPNVVRTAEYYEVEQIPDRMLTFTQRQSGQVQRYYESELDQKAIRDLRAQGWTMKGRKVRRKRVHKYILNGTRVLKDCGFIAGSNIPIVPVYGRRDFVDNQERWRGHVQKMMDRQRIYNTRLAKLVETDSLAPREVPILPLEMLSGFYTDANGVAQPIANAWARQNIDRLPFLPINPMRGEDGQIIAAAPPGKVDPPQLPPVTAALLQLASGDLTDQDDSADEVKANVSADAMDIAAARVDSKSGIYLDNMRQSIQREGEIYLGMAREVYYEPGRTVLTMNADEKQGTATIAEPYMDANNVYKIRNDLSQGSYNVVADVQESTATKQQRTVRQSLQMVEVLAPLVQMQDVAAAAALTAIMNMDGEGLDDFKTMARNKGIAIGLVKPTPEEQQQIERAQQGQQPSPADQALVATAQKESAAADLNKAKATEALSKAHLQMAQADALGGPDKAPETPTGLNTPPDPVEAVSKLASANLNNAKADHLRHDMSIKRIKTGHDIEMERRQHALAERQQQFTEQQPGGAQ